MDFCLNFYYFFYYYNIIFDNIYLINYLNKFRSWLSQQSNLITIIKYLVPVIKHLVIIMKCLVSIVKLFNVTLTGIR